MIAYIRVLSASASSCLVKFLLRPMPQRANASLVQTLLLHREGVALSNAVQQNQIGRNAKQRWEQITRSMQ